MAAGNKALQQRLERTAMEPSLIGWEWVIGTGIDRYYPAGPQWSPALSAGNGLRNKTLDAQPKDRNGAQPYRLGMVVVARIYDNDRVTAMEPSLIGWEWDKLDHTKNIQLVTAMEPSLIGWEWVIHSQIDAVLTDRNGAQPYRLGMGPVGAPARPGPSHRNGAQPYRLGMARPAQ